MISINRYMRLCRWCDALSDRLLRQHQGQIGCRKGCVGCCINLSVFPVEFYSILEQIRKNNQKPRFDSAAECGYLREDGSCNIYHHRPVICRTHGLPLVFLSPETEQPCVSFCEKNFDDLDDNYEFNRFNTLNLDNLNRRLFVINLQFITENPELGFTPTCRIELSDLLEHLQTG